MDYDFIKLILTSFSHLQFSVLIVATIIISLWLSYYLLFLSKNEVKVKRPIFYTYSLYLVFINIWVVSNAYFQSSLLPHYGDIVARDIGLLANTSSLLSANFAFIFSCLLVNSNRALRSYQRYTFSLGIIIAFSIWLYPESTIINVVIVDSGEFVINLGKASGELFVFGFILLCLTLRNFYLYRKNDLEINKTKSNYMMFGMSIYMTSTLICHIILPSTQNNYSLTWLPPALSIFEQVLVGYAILNNRFYSLRYIACLSVSYLFNIVLYLTPIIIVTNIEHDRYHLLLLGCWVIVSGVCWKKSLKIFQKHMNHFIYGSQTNTVNNIHGLVDDFKESSDKALKKVTRILNSNTGKIIKVGINPSQSALTDYLESQNKVIIKDELDFFIEYQTSNNERFRKIRNDMAENDSALILPIFNNNVITHLFMVSKKNEGGIFSSEEITALQLVLEQSNKYIYAEDEIRKSQLLAGSIAHEMKNPLSKIQYHFERIDADLFDLDASSLVPYASSDMKTIYQDICEVKSAVQLGSKFIEVILSELQGGKISHESFRFFSAKELFFQSLSDYNFECSASKDVISFDSDYDFIFKGNDTLFSFIIFNLLNNSLFYLAQYPDLKVTISLCFDNEQNKVIFTDTGPGISSAHLPYIFDDMYTTGKNHGNGLGLAYCKRVMKAFDGDITCRSEVGKFTEFTLRFPTVNLIHKNDTIHRFKGAMENKCCLLVGDFSLSMKLTVLLYELNTKVSKVDNLREMIHILSSDQFDFILISDDVFYQSNEALTSIRTGDLGSIAQATPIIACTKNDTETLTKEPSYSLIQGILETTDEKLLVSFQRVIEGGKLKPLGNLIGKKVLVVDDILVNRLLCKSYLDSEGITFLQAGNGKEAIDIVKSENVDFILMDIRMPIMNGFEATKEIRKISPSIPIVAVSGEYGKDVAEKVREMMEDHLMKPITKQRLLSIINLHLRDSPLSLRDKHHSHSAAEIC